MEMRAAILLAGILLVSCVNANSVETGDAHSFRVEKYELDEEHGCRRNDINVNADRAKEFFRRSREVEHRVIHDSYDIAPCSVYGVVTYKGKACRWNVNAGGTGWISCGEGTSAKIHYFACDNCDDLLNYKDTNDQ
jgi:hypothetical protein